MNLNYMHNTSYISINIMKRCTQIIISQKIQGAKLNESRL